MAEKYEISIQQPKRCYVDTIKKNAQKIVEYVRNRLKGDAEQSQLTMDLAPFAGASNNRPVKFLCAIQVLAGGLDRKSTRLNSSHIPLSRMPSSA